MLIKENVKKISYFVGSKFVHAYTKIMLQMDIRRKNYVPRGAKIIVANHPTTTDPFILTSISNGQASVLIKDVLFDVPVFGKYLRLSGHIPVSKENGSEAFSKALDKLKRGITVIVFIEGDLSELINKMKKPKTGAVRLAMLSGKPIIPMGISVKEKNVKNIKSVVKGVQEWGKWYFKGPYAISVGKPINIRGNIEDRNKVTYLSNWLSGQISKLAKESKNRLKIAI